MFANEVPRRVNRDGTRNVFCRRCHRFVGVSNPSMSFGSVSSCAICDAADNNIEIPPDILETLNAASLPVDGIIAPALVLQEAKRAEEAAKTDPMGNDPEAALTLRYWLKAATVAVVKTVREKLKTTSGAQALAAQKKRKRIFDRGIEELLEDPSDE